MKILVFAPHYDDEIIGAGGYIFKHLEQGHSVDAAFLTKIEPYREKEVQPLLDLVGFENVYRLDHASPRFSKKTGELVRKVISTIRSSAPTQVLIPHDKDGDPEHEFLHRLVMECSFVCEQDYLIGAGEQPHAIDTILGYEVWNPMDAPSLAVDITDVFEKKLAAMKQYYTQDFKHFEDLFMGLNSYRGVQTGKGKYVEVFKIYKAPESLFLEGIP